MPKENVNDVTQDRWRAEVSWRPEERVCECGTIWSAPVPDCPDCHRKDVPITSGHHPAATGGRLENPDTGVDHDDSTACGARAG